MPTPLPTEVTLLGWSVVLLLVHIAFQGGWSARERGLLWGAGARDDGHSPLGRYAGRAQRALAVTGRTGGTGETGAGLWFAARTVYLPLYLFGVPWLRTVAYGLSLAGLMMMLARLMG